MQEIKITENQAGQRFDKFLFKYFKEATSGFIYSPGLRFLWLMIPYLNLEAR